MSLRRRLALLSALAVALTVLLASGLVYALVSNRLHGDIDNDLRHQADLVAQRVEQAAVDRPGGCRVGPGKPAPPGTRIGVGPPPGGAGPPPAGLQRRTKDGKSCRLRCRRPGPALPPPSPS